ncbi:MAG TPA: PAS domain S-box protein, partial [Allocoleopsis sp.]
MDINQQELIALRQELAQVKSEKQQLEIQLLQVNQKLNQLETQLQTSQDENQKTLEQREAQFRLIADAAPISITISRVNDGNILYANQNACLTLGVEYEQLIKLSSKDFYYDDNDRFRLIEIFTKYGFVKDYEMPIKKADKTVIWVTVSLQSFMFNNDQTILSVLYEITQRKKAEEVLKEKEVLLQLVLDNIPQLIFWKDRNSVFLGCNQQWAEKAGFTSPQEVIGKTD